MARKPLSGIKMNVLIQANALKIYLTLLRSPEFIA